jgi:hypothetical protein
MPRFSTGLRNSLAVNYGLGIMMNSGIIRVYGGTIPDSPDNPPGTPELGRITTGGLTFTGGSSPNPGGLLLAFVSPGGLTMSGEWRLKGIATGTATWWRWCWAGIDDLTLNTLLPRVDGIVGTELQLVSTSITPVTDVEIEQFLFTISAGG